MIDQGSWFRNTSTRAPPPPTVLRRLLKNEEKRALTNPDRRIPPKAFDPPEIKLAEPHNPNVQRSDILAIQIEDENRRAAHHQTAEVLQCACAKDQWCEFGFRSNQTVRILAFD